ncbi:unnamed protein product [Amoebophrya sp. A25]|nr:unnamed protein product [Amoebophrya sp. A25]|eukprot:GSA25T00014007001.1
MEHQKILPATTSRRCWTRAPDCSNSTSRRRAFSARLVKKQMNEKSNMDNVGSMMSDIFLRCCDYLSIRLPPPSQRKRRDDLGFSQSFTNMRLNRSFVALMLPAILQIKSAIGQPDFVPGIADEDIMSHAEYLQLKRDLRDSCRYMRSSRSSSEKSAAASGSDHSVSAKADDGESPVTTVTATWTFPPGTINRLFDYHGSDRGFKKHMYGSTYDYFFQFRRCEVRNLLEIGIGSVNPKSPGHMLEHKDRGDHNYQPGPSLRVWRDLCPNAVIYGFDIDPDAMIRGEERIKTFTVDTTNKTAVDLFMYEEFGWDYESYAMSRWQHTPRNRANWHTWTDIEGECTRAPSESSARNAAAARSAKQVLEMRQRLGTEIRQISYEQVKGEVIESDATAPRTRSDAETKALATAWWKKSDCEAARSYQTRFERGELVQWDVIIDDGLHTPLANDASMSFLWPYLSRRNGLYLIEDLDGHLVEQASHFRGKFDQRFTKVILIAQGTTASSNVVAIQKSPGSPGHIAITAQQLDPKFQIHPAHCWQRRDFGQSNWVGEAVNRTFENCCLGSPNDPLRPLCYKPIDATIWWEQDFYSHAFSGSNWLELFYMSSLCCAPRIVARTLNKNVLKYFHVPTVQERFFSEEAHLNATSESEDGEFENMLPELSHRQAGHVARYSRRRKRVIGATPLL